MRQRFFAPMITLTLLVSACQGGPAGENQAEELAREIRADYIAMTGCAGHLELVADYGVRVFEYGADLTWKRDGETVLTLTAPENVAGTSARIAAGETALEFEGVMVETGPLDEAGLSPVDAVPLLLESAREGYIAECVLENWDGTARLHATCLDPETRPGEGREIQLWFDPESHALVRGEISAGGQTVIQCEVSGFALERAGN